MVLSCSSTHGLSNGVGPMLISCLVHEIWCVTYGTSFAYNGILFHVVLHIVSRSDTVSGVRLALALTVQKLVHRRIRPFVPLRGHSNGGGPHGLPPYLINILWQRYGTMVPHIRHYVHVLKDRGHG